jgi:small nuclear ribonucleoprotein (snRNP)-like protein
MTELNGFLDQEILIMTMDSRVVKGILTGLDPHTNVVLSDSKEHMEQEWVPVGVQLIRGDSILVYCNFE